MLKIIQTENAPKAIGPYSQAIVCGGLVYCSGQIPLDPETGTVVEGAIAVQTRRALDNLAAVLKAAGSSAELVLKTTCYFRDMSDFAEFNAVYETVLTGKPARSCVAVRELPKNVLVEIDAIAAII